MVKDAQKKIFQDYLEEHMHVSLNFKWQDFMYFQYIGCRDELGAAAYIAGAKYAAKISDEDWQVLVEYPTAIKKRKFVFHGASRAVQMLAKCYGGFISLNCIGYCTTRRNMPDILSVLLRKYTAWTT